MSSKSLTYIASALVSASMVANPLAAQAGGMSRMGTVSNGAGTGTLNCRPGVGTAQHGGFSKNIDASKNLSVYKPVTINNNININKNIDASKNTSITKNVDASKNISVYKPVTITKNIDNSKNININNNIDNSKNININKNITINNGGSSEAEATAIAAAIAAASSNSSSNASVNFYGSVNGGSATSNSSSSANASAYGNASSYNGGTGGNVAYASSMVAEAPGMFSGGDFGSVAVNVEAPAPVAVAAAPRQCTFQDTTVIKAIHAVCVSADNHEFPASHMLGDTWIESSYEGEIARCLPGSHLKVAIGAVFQSSEGLASGWSHGQTLECGAHEAVRHFKGGMLKCAPAVPVPDCTERTNLRKFGTGDMFFTYRTKVCMETHEEYSETESHMTMSRDEDLRGYTRAGSY